MKKNQKIIIEGKVIREFEEGEDYQILPKGIKDTKMNRFGQTKCLNCLLEKYEGKSVRITLTIEEHVVICCQCSEEFPDLKEYKDHYYSKLRQGDDKHNNWFSLYKEQK